MTAMTICSNQLLIIALALSHKFQLNLLVVLAGGCVTIGSLPQSVLIRASVAVFEIVPFTYNHHIEI